MAYIGDENANLRSRLSLMKGVRHAEGRRFKQTETLDERLAKEAEKLKAAADNAAGARTRSPRSQGEASGNSFADE